MEMEHYPLQYEVENTLPSPKYAFECRSLFYLRVDLPGVSNETLSLKTAELRNENGELQPCINVRAEFIYKPARFIWPKEIKRTYAFSIWINGNSERILANTVTNVKNGVLRLFVPDPTAKLNQKMLLHPRRTRIADTDDEEISSKRIFKTQIDEMNKKPYLFLHSWNMVRYRPGDDILEESVFPNPFIMAGSRSQFVCGGTLRSLTADVWDLWAVVDVPGINIEYGDIGFICNDETKCSFNFSKSTDIQESILDLTTRCFGFFILVRNATILMSAELPLVKYWIRDGRFFVTITARASFHDPDDGPSTSGRA